MAETKTYGELRDGDKIWFYGYKGTVRNVEVVGHAKDGPYAGERVIDFNVFFEPSVDHIEKTLYNGGRYGGVEHLRVAMRN